MDKSLYESYLNSKYCIRTEAGLFTLQPSEINNTFNQFLQKRRITTWAIITSYNPRSVIQNKDLNEHSLILLKRNLSNYSFYEGFNPKTEIWPEEATVFIANIIKIDAIKIARKYNQNAILYGVLDEKPQVIWCV